MKNKINTLGDFLDTFPNASWLEDMEGYQRYSNGEDEGSDYESAWFDAGDNICGRPDL